MMTAIEIRRILEVWIEAWNAHDLDGVMIPLHEEVVFENWDGRSIRGRRELRRSWVNWFENHGNFYFVVEEVFVDENAQKALLMWMLEWPSREKNLEGMRERRRGVDVIHFRDDKIIRKYTFSKTTIEVGGKNIPLTAGE